MLLNVQWAAHWKDGLGEVLSFRLSSAERVFEHRHWSPGLGMHSIYTTGFQCLRFTMQSLRTITLRTGKTDLGVLFFRLSSA
jgi:hypothetical protein